MDGAPPNVNWEPLYLWKQESELISTLSQVHGTLILLVLILYLR